MLQPTIDLATPGPRDKRKAASPRSRALALNTASELVLVDYTGAEITNFSRGGGDYFVAEVTELGDTTPSLTTIEIQAVDSTGDAIAGPDLLRIQLCVEGAWSDHSTGTLAKVAGMTTVTTHSSGKDLTVSQIRDTDATGTLTFTGVVIDGQTITIGDQVYEFDARTAEHVGAGNVRVDINSTAAKATRVLTMDTQPTVGDTVTVGTRTYSWVATGTADADGEISVGANLAAAKGYFVAAINGTQTAGHAVCTANTSATAAAFSSDTCTLTAIVGGTAGNSIVTTETFTAGTNVFAGATMTGGDDTTGAEAITALVTAITADADAEVTAVDGAGDTLVVTAGVTGTAGNDIATTETCTNASWGAATLEGGVDAVPGLWRVTVSNGTANGATLRIGAPYVGSTDADYSETLDFDTPAA